MSARWSKTRAAVNHGWGIVNPNRNLIHPEYLMEGPYGTIKTVHASRGGAYHPDSVYLPDGRIRPALPPAARRRDSLLKIIEKRTTPRGGRMMLKKGSPEAKAFMAKLRAMRGKSKTAGKKGGARIRGPYSSYNMAALEGSGLKDILKKIGRKIKVSVKKLLENPEPTKRLIKEFAPSAVGLADAFLGKSENEEVQRALRVGKNLTDPRLSKKQKSMMLMEEMGMDDVGDKYDAIMKGRDALKHYLDDDE